MQGLRKKQSVNARGSKYILGDVKAGMGPLARGDAVFSEQTASIKDLDGFI